MKRPLGLRARMMLLFCAAVGVLLAASFGILYAWQVHHTHTEFDRLVLEASAPVAADITSDGDPTDINQLNLPDEYFEVVSPGGQVLARSLNLAFGTLRLPRGAAGVRKPTVFGVRDPSYGHLRLAAVPVTVKKKPAILLLGMPTHRLARMLGELRRGLGLLFGLSLAVMALVSAWYVGRSLRPIAALTEHTSLLSKRLETPGSLLANHPLPDGLAGRSDEIGQLAEAFEELWERMRNAVGQLRQFVSDASHELRTPLAVLRGETDLVLSERRTEEEYRQALQVIQDELGQLSRIVDGLFTLTLADAGQLRLSREPLYLNEVLEEACQLAETRARAKQISIERSLGNELPYQGDETWLRQLFLAFLDNAVKYSPPGTRVRVTLEARNGAGASVRFRDEGPGIAAEHLPHIFERFYRAGTGEAQSGGLGLAIAEAIARACGGMIECSSVTGGGSEFTVNLPAAAPEANLNKN
ncbi:MAG TPA: HAMP domain-containing sensor histidine kinase [Patescibacteria group bacterium]|nr:HAMP domain-containing sensor histidine kinase [Patescibacteria group bacterium]